MSAPSCPWSDSSVSRLWSAKGDDRCSPPRSDDYKHWSLMQLKREITQRQLKTNPRRRNKDAFVRVLLQNDHEEQTKAQARKNTTRTQQPQALDDPPVLFVASSTSELPNVYVHSGDPPPQQEDITLYGTKGGHPQQQQQELYLDHPHPHQQQEMEPVYVDPGEQPQQEPILAQCEGMQAARVAALSTASTPTPTQSLAPVAPSVDPALESDGDSFQVTKRQRMERAGQESEESGESVKKAAASEMTNGGESTARPSGKRVSEYWRRKLSVQAARLEIESRRLDLETKREQRDNELHAVQLALAQEQLQQAELTTQKMKTEWMVEKMIQKKRLNDAGISQNDSSTLGMYLS